jgi:hypothetical protein
MRIGFSQRLTNTKRSWLEDISAHNLRPARVCSKHTAAYSFRASLFSMQYMQKIRLQQDQLHSKMRPLATPALQPCVATLSEAANGGAFWTMFSQSN